MTYDIDSIKGFVHALIDVEIHRYGSCLSSQFGNIVDQTICHFNLPSNTSIFCMPKLLRPDQYYVVVIIL